MSSCGVEKKVRLKSSDGEILEVEETVALESQTIKKMVEDGHADKVIELSSAMVEYGYADKVINLSYDTLLKVMDYCKQHVEARRENKEDELKTWDLRFVEVDKNTLFELASAAYYLNIQSLVNLTCQTVADMIKGRTPLEIRKILNYEADLTPEEEEEIRRENAWAFE